MSILLLYGEKCEDKKVEEQKDVAVSSAKPVFLTILILTTAKELQKASYNVNSKSRKGPADGLHTFEYINIRSLLVRKLGRTKYKFQSQKS